MCEIEFDDGDPVAGYRARPRKARKEHHCECCGLAIKPGETYEYASWIANHEPDWEKQCAACAADNREFANAHGVYLFASAFYTYLHECVVDPYAEADDEETKRWRPMLERLEARREAAKAAA
jgi:hypothetical protein